MYSNKNIEKLKQTRGITLIALVVTIIILIILATISINTAINGGLIGRAETAKEKAEIAKYEERIKMITADEKTEKIIDKKEGKLIDLVKTRLEDEDWVKEIEKLEDDEILRVRTEDKYEIIAKIDEKGNVEIIEEGKDDGEPYPSIKLTQIPLEGEEKEKVKIKVEGEVEKTSKSKKITKARLVRPEDKKQEKDYEEGGVIFEVEGNGTYTFEVETNVGKTRRKTIVISIVAPESDIEISSEPTTPRNTEKTVEQNGVETGPIIININYGGNNFKNQYRKEGDEDWTTITEETKSFKVTKNIAIFARYYDGTNAFKTVVYNIQNVDNVAPNAFKPTETHTTNSITVTAKTGDSASTGASSTIAGILRYEYRIYKNSAWGSWQTSNKFTGLATGTYKVQAKAIDKAGNETISDEKQIETGEVTSAENGAIVFENLKWNSGKAEVTIKKTTNDSFKIRYKVLNTNAAERISYTEISSGGVVSNLNLGEMVVAQLYDGVNGGKTVTLNVQDNTNPVVTVSQGQITTNSIEIRVTAVDNEAGMPNTPSYKYYVKKSSDSVYSLVVTTNNANYTYTNLEQNTNYDFKVETTDIAGNTGNGEIKNIKTETVTGLTNANTWFTYSTTEWTNGSITATAHTNVTGYTLQTSKSPNTGYTNTDSQTFDENGTIYARVVDSTGQATGYASGNITKIDKSSPTYTGAEIKNITESGYDVYVYGVSDVGSGVSIVQFPTWTINNGQDDIIWGIGTDQGNGTWYYRVNISDHNNEFDTYVTHIYIDDALNNRTGPIELVASIIKKGAFIKYDVEYTDTYMNYEYTNINGWRLENYKLASDGKTLSNVRLISTGIPAMMNYGTTDTTNNYSKWVTDETKLNEFKKVLGNNNKSNSSNYFVLYTGSDTYYALQATAGYYYNLGQMTFEQGTTYDKNNQGYYTKVKNGSTEYTSGETTGEKLFVARSDANIRILTLPELNNAFGINDADANVYSLRNNEDTTGLYKLNEISTRTKLTNNTYTTGSYWLASPWPNKSVTSCVMIVDLDNHVVRNVSSGYIGVRPLVSLESKVQLVKKTDSTGFEYYEMVNVN